MENNNASNSLTVRIKLNHKPGVLAKVTHTIGENGGNIGAIDIAHSGDDYIVRDITIFASSPKHGDEIINALKQIDDAEVINYSDRTFLIHLGGKIETVSKIPIKTRDDLSMAYTPGVARVCQSIHKNPDDAHKLTIKSNTIAVISDGTAVLGLGDIGPYAAMPVMEGKAMLFKDFGGINAFPICLDTKDVEEIIKTIKIIAPGFGGINLEDISAPRCFEIEKRLKDELDIPVFHDDQHGTAVVLTAALINSLKVVKKDPKDIKVVIAGVGAAGTACTKMLLNMGIKNIIGCDRTGALFKGRDNMNESKKEYASITNPNSEKGSLKEIMHKADVFVGVSGPNIIDEDDLKNMNKDSIVFPMSNPTPEIDPEIAYKHAAIVGTGRSDYPNQINNVLCFPGIFKGALECKATTINEEMKLAAAVAIANTISESHLHPDYIIPSVFHPEIAEKVAEEVIKAAIKTNVIKQPRD
ncbi:MAG: NAD-dependent malic enzyme [Planctomycetota bacterium]|nr:MAG: NAD-dependent malic enzyme [Planctomycetota bacterium]